MRKQMHVKNAGNKNRENLPKRNAFPEVVNTQVALFPQKTLEIVWPCMVYLVGLLWIVFSANFPHIHNSSLAVVYIFQNMERVQIDRYIYYYYLDCTI